jgi:DNA-binding Xre family transcriptional regulator
MQNLRDRVKTLLAEHEMDQQELAFRSGVSQATISGFLSGRKEDMKTSTIRKIATVLGCQVEIHLVNTGFSC